jgi:hypothetical protein
MEAHDVRTITEPERTIPVLREVDVVVAGGGPAGFAAAIAAARNGARTLLVERYGYLGGMMTGSHVTWLFGFSNGERQVVHGIAEELVHRLEEVGGITGRRQTEIDCNADPEILKWLFVEMLEEAGVEVLLHSWVSGAVMDKDTCRGIFVECKDGRRAILADVTVDATADGDVSCAAGAEMTDDCHDITLVKHLEGVDKDRVSEFRQTNPERYDEILAEVKALGGAEPGKVTRYYQGRSAVSVEDLTRTEIDARRETLRGLVHLRKHMPGYENARLTWTAPQLGVRESRKIVGESVLTEEDIRGGLRSDDSIGRCGAHLLGYALYKVGPLEYDIPYGCLVPERIDGLLASGRCVSTTHEAMNTMRLIVPCFLTGEAAGTAAGLAAKHGVRPRDLDVALLQERMRAQNNNLG